MRSILLSLLLVACGGGDKPATPNDAAGDAALDASPDAKATTEEALRACVVLGSLDHQGPSECFDDYIAILNRTEIRCLAAAGADSVAAAACIGLVPTTVPCTKACAGDVVQCGYATAAGRFDLQCGKFFASRGSSCLIGNDGAQCGAGTCTTASRTCDGDKLLECNPATGVLDALDCARLGWTCSTDGGIARCVDTTTTACDPTAFADRCDGTRRIDCLDNVEVGVDCARHVDGMSCLTRDSDAECGIDGPACGVADRRAETCNGTTITFCAGGGFHAVDCAALGFTQCMPGDGSTGGRCL